MKGIVGGARRIEEAMLDVVGDENAELVQKQRMMRWDKSKRKYVQTTVGAELSGMSRGKKLRLESGQLVKSDKMKVGEAYEKWQKKTNRSVGRNGVFDEAEVDTSDVVAGSSGRKKHNSSDVKSSQDILKEREKKKNMKIKNMKKGDRKRMEQQQKQSKSNTMPKHGKKLGKGFQSRK